MKPSFRRLIDLFKKDSLIAKLRRIAVNTTIAGVAVIPTGQAMSSNTAAPIQANEPLIVNRERRTGESRLVFHPPSQNILQLTSSATHSSHASHASHASGTTGTVPKPAATTPNATAPATPATNTTATPAPNDADSQNIQKLNLTVLSVNKLERYILAKDTFDTEFKIYYSPDTKITTLGTGGTTRTVAAILAANAQAEFFKKGQDLSVIWEAQNTKRVALKVTVLE